MDYLIEYLDANRAVLAEFANTALTKIKLIEDK
jgi:hypothetical protein